jgi:hypothetical protein
MRWENVILQDLWVMNLWWKKSYNTILELWLSVLKGKNVVYVSYNTIISLVLIMGLILCMWVLHFLETRWWEKGRWCCHRLSTTWLSLVMLYPCNFTIKCLILSYYIRATYESFVSVLLFSYLNAMQIESKCEQIVVLACECASASIAIWMWTMNI